MERGNRLVDDAKRGVSLLPTFILAVVVGVVAATGWSWLLSWCAGLPRISPVSLAAAAERSNTPANWLATFAVAACAALLLQWFVRSLISLLIRFCRPGPERGTR